LGLSSRAPKIDLSSFVEGIRCTVAAENGSDRTAGEARVCGMAAGVVFCEEADGSGRGSVSIAKMPGAIALRPGDGPRALDR
jgi:hypothetical protein